MLRPILLLLFTQSVSFCYSQNSRIDSLEKLLLAHSQEDTIRVKLLLDLANAFTYDIPDSAMKYTNDAMGIAEKLKWQKGLAGSYRSKGLIYYVITDNLNAMDWFYKALKANELLNDGLYEATIYNNMGNIYADLSQYDKALTYYNKLLTSAQAIGNKNYEIIALVNIGNIYTYLSDLAKGLDYFQKSFALLKEEPNTNFELSILNNMGRIYDKMKNFPKAIYFYEQSLHLATIVHNQNVKATALNNISKVYTNMQNYEKAEGCALQSLQVAKDINMVDGQADALENLSKIYESQQKNAKALKAYKSYITLRDSTINAETKSEITRKEMQYNFSKVQDSLKAINDKRETLASAELKQQKTVKNSILTGSGIFILSGFLLFLSYKRRRDANTKRKDAELKAQIADTEMKVMRLQMNPHFIFNSLNSISDYIIKNNPQEADAYLSKFAKVMRMTLENSEQQAISLEDDLKMLELYMQLEAKRLNNKFTYEVKVADDVDLENTLVPPMIFQPFVENSIWHGIAKKEGQGHIIIGIRKENEMLYCFIDDDGVGRQSTAQPVELKEKKSLGMKITKARIDILNSLKGSNATVQLIDKPQGLLAELTLPLQIAY